MTLYSMKAIPTVYAGTRFRSRLEARWAAFFDLAHVEWQYEPIDLAGWAPDFLIKPPSRRFRPIHVSVLVEVKPVEMWFHKLRLHNAGADGRASYSDGPFAKAVEHWQEHQVLLCGLSPGDFQTGVLLDRPRGATYDWQHLFDALNFLFGEKEGSVQDNWREAGNLVQWRGAE